MTSIVIRGFGGKIPRIGDQELPDNAARVADNVRLFGRTLESWRRGTLIYEPVMTAIQSIYRLDDGVTDYWLSWQTTVHIVKTPGITDHRIFFTGDVTPRKTDPTLTAGLEPYPADHKEMGIPTPPAITATATTPGSGTNSERNYVVTYVTDWGEEGPPSPASNTVTFGDTGFTIDLTAIETGVKTAVQVTRSGSTANANVIAHGFYNGSKVLMAGAVQPEYNGEYVITVVDADNFTYQITGTPVSPATGTITCSGNYGLSKVRLYRSLAGTTGIVAYQLVKEMSFATSTTDSVLDSNLGFICQSFENGVADSEWVQPPSDMTNIQLHPGNFAVGISGNLVCFSEPGNLHAWPVRYQIELDYAGVGIGIVGSTVVVGTEGGAYRINGQHPAFMSKDSDDGSDPAVSSRGFVTFPFGVIYPSPNGLYLVGVGGTVNAIEEWAKREEWEDYFPETMFSANYQDIYFGFYDTGSTVRGFTFDRTNQQGPLTDLAYNITAVYTDPQTKKLYYVEDDIIYEWAADVLNNAQFDWWSKIFVLPRPVNMGVAQIEADWSQLDDAAAQAAQLAIDQAANAAILAVDPTANIPDRVDSTAYVVSDTVMLGNQQLYCTVAGTTDSSPPSLSGKLLYDTVTDNTVTWKLVLQYEGNDRGNLNDAQFNEFTLHGSLLSEPQIAGFDNRFVTFQFYADEVLKYTKSVLGNTPFKLPSGYKDNRCSIRITGNIEVYAVKVSQTMRELAEV